MVAIRYVRMCTAVKMAVIVFTIMLAGCEKVGATTPKKASVKKIMKAIARNCWGWRGHVHPLLRTK